MNKVISDEVLKTVIDNYDLLTEEQKNVLNMMNEEDCTLWKGYRGNKVEAIKMCANLQVMRNLKEKAKYEAACRNKFKVVDRANPVKTYAQFPTMKQANEARFNFVGCDLLTVIEHVGFLPEDNK